MIESAFWDTSAAVPLCLQQDNSSFVHRLLAQFGMAVWWATPVEARSALARELRNGFISATEHSEALLKLNKLKEDWREIVPDENLRSFAEALPDRFPLRAADALQLSASYMWALQSPAGRPFISGDKRLLDAAQHLGFRAIAI